MERSLDTGPPTWPVGGEPAHARGPDAPGAAVATSPGCEARANPSIPLGPAFLLCNTGCQ